MSQPQWKDCDYARVIDDLQRLPKDWDKGGRLARYITRPFPIKYTFKGKVHNAWVRANGTITYQGRVFTSPSGAAQAVTEKPADGWETWRYERAPGDWVPLSELRK